MKNSIQSTLRGATFIMAASLVASLAAQTQTTSAPAATTTTTTTSPGPVSVNLPDNTKLAHHDKSFLKKAAESGMKEVAVSQAVLGTLTNPEVKNFANMMVNDHTAANRELMTLAMGKGVMLPEADKKWTEKWSDKSGNVDKKYMHEMVEDHEDSVKLFEKAAKSDDAEIAAFANRTLPTLQHHLQMAKDLKKSL